MTLKDLGYKIGERKFSPRDVVEVFFDGVNFTLTYVEVIPDRHLFYKHTITCPTDDVEVMVDGT